MYICTTRKRLYTHKYQRFCMPRLGLDAAEPRAKYSSPEPKRADSDMNKTAALFIMYKNSSG